MVQREGSKAAPTTGSSPLMQMYRYRVSGSSGHGPATGHVGRSSGRASRDTPRRRCKTRRWESCSGVRSPRDRGNGRTGGLSKSQAHPSDEMGAPLSITYSKQVVRRSSTVNVSRRVNSKCMPRHIEIERDRRGGGCQHYPAVCLRGGVMQVRQGFTPSGFFSSLLGRVGKKEVCR